MGAINTKSPALRDNAGYRAHFVRDETIHTIAPLEREADLAPFYISQRFELALPLAQAIAMLARIGRVLL
jgi:hypothetical protein